MLVIFILSHFPLKSLTFYWKISFLKKILDISKLCGLYSILLIAFKSIVDFYVTYHVTNVKNVTSW